MKDYEIRHMERLREDFMEGEITEAEFRRQYAPMLKRLVDEYNARTASVGRNPKGHDPKGHGAKHEHAVGAEGDETPKGEGHA